MPIAYRIDTERDLGVAVWHGKVTDADVRAQDVQVRADSDWPPRKVVTDITSVSEMPGLSRMVQLGKDTGAQHAGVRVAIVASKLFDVATDFERTVATSGLGVIVFNEIGTACAWLGVDRATVEVMIGRLRDRLRADSGPS